jgi:RHS repeat-associated protein
MTVTSTNPETGTICFRSDCGYNHTYNYDSFGNLHYTPPTGINPSTNQLQLYVNNVNVYSYDAAGNLISSGTSDIGGHSYTYNALSQTTSVDGGSTGSYVYNGLDERVYKSTASGSTSYVYLNGQPMAEYASAGVWTDYIYAEGQKIAKIATPVSGATALNYYLDDHLGTTQVELDSSGMPLWQGQFTPFGAELPDGSTTMHYKFTGKERDAESGLDDFGARYYASSMGHWMSPDWSAKEEPVPYAKLDNPQSLNLYSYVHNNPLSNVDIDGHSPDWWQKLRNKVEGHGWYTDADLRVDATQRADGTWHADQSITVSEAPIAARQQNRHRYSS